MTAPATTRRAGPFNGNGATTSFPFTFKVFATSDISVIKTSTAGLGTTLALGADYSVTLNADQDATPGGSITYPISGTALASGEKLTALGALPYDQTADLPTGGNYRAVVVENALDRTVMQVQQVAEGLGRALTLPVSAAGADTELPVPEGGKVIAWNAAGTGLVNVDSSDLASVVVAGTAYTNIFNGTGAQTAFALTADPGGVNALDVAISGVSQVNGVDFTVSGTTLTFTSAPVAGTGNIAVRYVASVPVGSANAQDVGYGSTTVEEFLNRFKVIIGGGGVADDRARLQTTIDALTTGQTLICRGIFRTVNEVFIKTSNITLDLHAATFQFDGQTGYGGGILVGDPTTPATMPTNVAILGGKITVAGGGVAYPGADWNPIAVLTGRDIRIIGATIYPKASTRAISIQTDATFGSGGVAIDNVVVDVTVIGDGNASDGVDITSSGRDGLIGKVTVRARVSGCKRGVNVSPGNDIYTYTGIDMDVEVHSATEVAGNFSRLKSSRLKVRAIGCTKGGITTRQLIDCDTEFQVIGTGGALTNAYEIVDGATIGSTRYRLSAVGPWATGVLPQQHDAIYEAVEVDGATLGIDISGFRSTWGLVTLKNCTTTVDDLNSGTDAWGIVTQHNTGSSPRVIRQSMAASSGTARYATDLHGEDTITIAAGATSQPFGASSAFGGLLVVHGLAGTGDQALFQVANGLTKLVSDTGTTYSATSGTVSRVNVYLSASVVTIQNNLAVSVTLRVRADRMRNSP